MDAHAAGVCVGGAPGQTPTSVADLYPDGMEFSSLALGQTHAGDDDVEIFAKYHPSYCSPRPPYTHTRTTHTTSRAVRVVLYLLHHVLLGGFLFCGVVFSFLWPH